MTPPRYLEPSTDVPAAEDWSTRMDIAEWRWAARAMGITAAVFASVAVAAVVLAEPTAGTLAAVVLLALLTLCCALGPLSCHFALRPLRRGLLDAPWRRCPATVTITESTEVFDRVVVFDGPHTIVLRGLLGPDVPDIVLHRQELFLCGPDADGHVALRVAGLSRTLSARVVEKEWRPKERDPLGAIRPLDDPAVTRAFRTFRCGRYAWLGSAGLGTLGAAVVVMSLFPVAPFGLAVGGLTFSGALVLLPGLLQLSALYRRAVAALCDAVTWTPVPVTLFPREPGHEVTGLAQLPGDTALVTFPIPHVDVVANIADTGAMWICGEPRPVVAVGLPRLPVLAIGLVETSKGEPNDSRQPLALRHKAPALREVPALQR